MHTGKKWSMILQWYCNVMWLHEITDLLLYLSIVFFLYDNKKTKKKKQLQLYLLIFLGQGTTSSSSLVWGVVPRFAVLDIWAHIKLPIVNIIVQ